MNIENDPYENGHMNAYTQIAFDSDWLNAKKIKNKDDLDMLFEFSVSEDVDEICLELIYLDEKDRVVGIAGIAVDVSCKEDIEKYYKICQLEKSLKPRQLFDSWLGKPRLVDKAMKSEHDRELGVFGSWYSSGVCVISKSENISDLLLREYPKWIRSGADKPIILETYQDSSPRCWWGDIVSTSVGGCHEIEPKKIFSALSRCS